MNLHYKIQILSPDQAKEEYEKCKNDEAYFYNNFCKKENDPEYTKEIFEKYKNSVSLSRLFLRPLSNRKDKIFLNQLPLTPEECFSNRYTYGIDPYDKKDTKSKGSMGFNQDEIPNKQ